MSSIRRTFSVRAAVCLGAILGLVLAMPLWAKGKSGGGNGGGTSTVYLTTVVHDFDASGAELLMKSDDYNGSGQATYTNALNAGVISDFDSSGKWRFDLYPQKTGVRTLWITPNDVYSSTAASVPGAAYYWQSVEVYSGCRDQAGNVVPFQNILNSSDNCSMGVDFGYNGVTYKLFMGSVEPGPGPATGLAKVTCNSVGTINGVTQCVNWTITPYADPGAPSPTVANLYSYWSSRGKSGWTYIGQYYNTFRIDVTNP